MITGPLFSLTSDLAIEARDLLRGQGQVEIPGVIEEKKEFAHGSVTTITITSPEASKIMAKAPGRYVTIYSPELRNPGSLAHGEIASELATQLRDMINNLHLLPQAPALLVGLGNWDATPDALGPKVINKCLVTRHLKQYAPQSIPADMRAVSAIAPGVLGITGIESAEIIRGVVEKIRPHMVIAIDALTAGNVDRIGSTIQLSDTGINPGSGVGNKRLALNRETLGVPVIAIGIPTVVPADLIVREVLNAMTSQQPAMPIPQPVIDDTISRLLAPFGGHLTVTPKEIDGLVENTSRVLARGLNQGLHDMEAEVLDSLTL